MKRILPLLLVLLFAGCASMGDLAELPPEVRAADQLLASGHARDAAQSYAAQAAAAHGAMHDLLEVRALPAVALKQLDGTPFDLSSLKGKWLMINVDSGACAKACEDKLFMMRQLRLMQERKMIL